ncbi:MULTISPECIES: DUF7736 domain-containing protein [unclassified Microbacterium]|uniref:DUF7736 domain-containing protein n=1 Tax=unclassified Microbacterium TaxID=2609290 RepID=UPI00301718FF
MAESKEFHIGDILSILSGKLVSPSHIGGIYAICDWMTDRANMTHQLPRVSGEIEAQLREDFPDLAAVEVPAGLNSEEKVLSFLASLDMGETRMVERLRDPADHTDIDPIAEIRMINPNAKIITI